MPRFDWVLLFNKTPGKRVLVIGNHQDAQEIRPVADHLYLLPYGADAALLQKNNIDGGSITLVQEDEIAALDVDSVAAFFSEKTSGKLRALLKTTFPHEKHHMVHHYKSSTLLTRILQCLALYRVHGSFLYFPYTSFESNHFIDLFRKGMRFKEMLQLLKHIVARKAFGVCIPKAGEKSNIESVMYDVSQTLNLNISVPSRIRNGTTGSFLADLGDYIVRIPYSDSANDQFCKNNFMVLRKLVGMDLPFRVPVPVGEGTYQGTRYYVESKIQGASLDLTKKDAQDPRVVDAIFTVALNALKDPRMKAGWVTEQSAYSFIQHEMLGLSAHLTAEQVRLYDRFAHAFAALASKVKVPLVITHGDFKNANFIISLDENPAIAGVIDWEFSPTAWFPFYDFWVLVVNHFHQWEKGQHELVQYVYELEQGRNRDSVHELMEHYRKALSLDTDLVLPIMVICMLRHMNVNYFAEFAAHKDEQYWSNVFTDYIDPLATKFLKSA